MMAATSQAVINIRRSNPLLYPSLQSTGEKVSDGAEVAVKEEEEEEDDDDDDDTFRAEECRVFSASGIRSSPL